MSRQEDIMTDDEKQHAEQPQTDIAL